MTQIFSSAETQDNTSKLRNASWLLPPVILGILILPFVQWSFTDDEVFIQYYVLGHSYPPLIGPGSGRFVPLGHQEWRLLPWMTQAWMFHGFALIEYFVFCFVIWTIVSKRDDKLSLLFFIVTLPPIVISFSNIVLFERNQLLLLSLWFLFYDRWQRSRNVSYGLFSLLFANLALYFKEPTCLFVGGFAVTQLFLSHKFQDGRNLFRERWIDVALIVSSAIFLLAYFSVVSIHAITASSAYNGHYVSLSKGLPTLGRLAVKDPPLVLLITAGLGLAIHRLFVVKSEPPYFGLWLGSALYLSSLAFAGLYSKYYDALPALGFALQIQAELSGTRLGNFSRVACWVLVFVNAIFWLPEIAYKYDWTERNAEMTDHIVEYSQGSQRGILLRKADPWDADMFMIYAQGIRGLKSQFYCDGVVVEPCQSYDGRDLDMMITLDDIDGAISGTLNVESREVWRYEGIWIRLIPKTVRFLLSPHYNIW